MRSSKDLRINDPEPKRGTYTLFFVRIYSIRISRLRFGQNILGISKNNRLGMRLTVLNESLHHGMQFKAISGGGEGTEFEKLKLEVKNNRAWEKISPFL